MKKAYQHIFFDLDRTLWDFETNSKLALATLFEQFQLPLKGINSFDKFHQNYKRINDSYWQAYANGNLTKEDLRWVRFYSTFEYFGLQDKLLAIEFGEAYVNTAPYNKHLLPGVIEVLDRLKGRCQLHIITNGFEEAQMIKLSQSGLMPYFKEIITSENAGYKKPAKEIFLHAMQVAGVQVASSCLMVGDDFNADIKGAKNAGMDAIWFSKTKSESTYTTISEMQELLLYVELP